jgi:hypothetical protein
VKLVLHLAVPVGTILLVGKNQGQDIIGWVELSEEQRAKLEFQSHSSMESGFKVVDMK